MIERITRNEKRLESAISSIRKLEEALEEFKLNKKNIEYVNKYYGSNNWFKDKEAVETNKVSNIKAGVLSEDSVWNMNEDIDNIMLEMKKIILSNSKKRMNKKDLNSIK